MLDGIAWFFEKVLVYVAEPYRSWDAFLHAVTLGVRLFTETESKLHGIYLGSSLLLGVFAYAVEKHRRTVAPDLSLVRFLFPREVYRHPSAVVDYKYVAIDMTIKSLTYSPLITGVSYLSYKAILWLSQLLWLGLIPPLHVNPVVVAFLTVVVADFGFFFGHYLGHKVPLFWIFHQVHHSAEVLTPLTTFRGHPIDELLGTVVTSMVTGMFALTYTTATGEPVSMATILGVNMFTFFFYLVGYQLRHSHIWLSYGPIFSWVFISPAQHQIHHSKDPKHWDKNFGFIFSVWDLLFGSLYVPRSKETLELGIANVDPDDFASVGKLYFLPFVKAWKYILGRSD
jgi:sterol desaturase/sphingolipid hydroxylase (fatty acid hydroxylase superfamily)